jgi:hypothetical protein
MPPDDTHYTYNELSNEDKELLLANGHKPGELPPEEEQEILRDLKNENSDDFDASYHSIIADEQDGTEE